MTVLVAGCISRSSPTSVGPHGEFAASRVDIRQRREARSLDQVQALAIAAREFERVFTKPDALCHFRIFISQKKEEGAWRVFFEGQGEYALPGYFLTVNVNWTTGTVEVWPGD